MTTQAGQENLNNPREQTRAADELLVEGPPIRLRSTLAQFTLDDDLVLFSEESQRLVGLNSAAASIFYAIHAGTPLSALPETLVAQGLAGSADANFGIRATIEALRSHGMIEGLDASAAPTPARHGSETNPKRIAKRLAGMPPYESFSPVAEKCYRLLETKAKIRFGHAAQLRLIDAALGHLATSDDSEPTLVIDLPGMIWGEQQLQLRSGIFCDGILSGYAGRLSRLTPIVKGLLWSAAVNAHDFVFYFHAGVLGMDTSCLLLPAAAGSGKSTLTTALCHSGFDYFSDEVALIEPTTFQVSPLPLAICVKKTGWDVMARYFPHIWDLPTHFRQDGKWLRYVRPPEPGRQSRALPVSHIFFPRYQEAAATELKAIPRRDALGRLMEECLALRRRLDREIVGDLVDWIRKIDCFTLTYSSLDEAVARIRETVGGGEAIG